MWTYNLNIFIDALYIQAVVLILIVIVTYFLYFFYRSKTHRKKIITAEIAQYLLDSLDKKQAVSLRFKSYWKKLIYLIQAVKFVDAAPDKDVEAWTSYKIEFVKQHLLPLARKQARSARWLCRFLAANVFAIFASLVDEKMVGKLIQDRRASVAIESVGAIQHIPTEYLLNLLIDQMATYRRKSYDLFLTVFKEVPPSSRDVIVHRLAVEKNSYKRDICYRILMYFPPISLTDETSRDAKSTVLELCLSAIRYIGYSNDKMALPFLHQLLSDSRWQIKIAVLQALGELGDRDSIHSVTEMQNDPEWWVRRHAQQALARIEGGSQS